MVLEGPETVARPAEARLHLVDDHQAATRPNLFGGTGEVAFRHFDDAAIALDRFHDHARQLAGGGVLDGPVDLRQIGLGVGAEDAAIGVGVGDVWMPPRSGMSCRKPAMPVRDWAPMVAP